ncbi:MAG: PP2C family protein-serine/threonine phosphatase [Thermoguttaceae bacterium]
MNPRQPEREYSVEHAALSDVGLRRSNNQDSLIVGEAQRAGPDQAPGHLLLVADGMGAHAAGEVASRVAAETVLRVYRAQENGPPEEALRTAIREANSALYRQGIASDELRGMGTTVSSLLLLPQEALVGHVGDSRVYRLRGDELQQLTFDHSLVWEICAAENVVESQVPAFVPRNIITRSVGPTPEVEVDLEGPFSLRAGDVFLLCSDGLSGQIEDEEIGTVLRVFDPDEAAHILVDLANLRGSPDNVTVIVARVNRLQPARPSKANHPEVLHQASLATKIFRPVVTAAGLFGLGWLMSGPLLAISAALAGGSAAGFWSFRKGKPGATPVTPSRVRPRLGKAPYTTCDCSLNDQSSLCMAKAVQEIRDVAINRLWQVNWDRYEELAGKAIQAANDGKHEESVRAYGEILRFFADQFRNTIHAEK